MDTTALVIPVRFGIGGAVQNLTALGTAATQQAAQTQAKVTKGAQDAAKAQIAAAKEAAALIAQVNRNLADKSAAAQDRQAQAAKSAANQQKQAAQDAFASWKAKADEQHRTAMWMWEDQQAATSKAAEGVKGFGGELAGLMKAQLSVSAISGVIRTLNDGLNKAADFSRDVAKEFVGLRKTMQEVAALRGVSNSDEFTLDEAKKAKEAGLTPGERRDFQAEFLNYAGSQVGGANEAELKANGTKLTDSQGEEFGNRVAALMKAKGIKNLKVGAELAGSMLEQGEGPQDVDKLMERFSRGFNVSQKGRVPLERAIPDLSQIMSMGVSLEDASKMYAIVSPAASGQEGTSVQAALRAVQEMKNKGTGDEFGVKQGMSQYDSVKAFAENINKRQQDLMAQGKSEQEASDIVQKQLADKQVAADSREARGLVRGFGGQGVRLGGFQRFEKIEADTSATYEKDAIKQYRDSAAGEQDMRDADEAVARAERGKINVRLEELRQEARIQLTREGRFEQRTPDDYVRMATEKLGAARLDEQLVNERAIANTKKMVGHQDTAGDRAIEAAFGTERGFMNQSTNERIKELLEEQNQLMKKDAQAPLTAPPPARNGGARM